MSLKSDMVFDSGTASYCDPCRHKIVCKFKHFVLEHELKNPSNISTLSGTVTSPITYHIECKFMDREEKE